MRLEEVRSTVLRGVLRSLSMDLRRHTGLEMSGMPIRLIAHRRNVVTCLRKLSPANEFRRSTILMSLTSFT